MFLGYKSRDGIRYGTIIFLLLSVLWFSSGADARVWHSAGVKEISQTGFIWWKNFIHERRAIQRDALACLHVHDPSCWGALAQKIKGTIRKPRDVRFCVSVRFQENQYWVMLARYSRALAVGISKRHPPRALHARLDAAGNALRRMADEGVCERR